MDKIDLPEEDYLYFQPSQIKNAGNGLFTAIDIFKGEQISIFTGKKLNQKEADALAAKGLNGYFINTLDGGILDSANTICFAKYANDAYGSSLKNNAEIQLNDVEQICLVAIKKIKAGEEIFCNYGKKYWSNK